MDVLHTAMDIGQTSLIKDCLVLITIIQCNNLGLGLRS